MSNEGTCFVLSDMKFHSSIILDPCRGWFHKPNHRRCRLNMCMSKSPSIAGNVGLGYKIIINLFCLESNPKLFTYPNKVLIMLLQESSLFTWSVPMLTNIFELVENWLNILPNVIESIFLTDCDGRVDQLCDREWEGWDSNFCSKIKSDSNSVLLNISSCPLGCLSSPSQMKKPVKRRK